MTAVPAPTKPSGLPLLVQEVRACALCAEHLPHGPRPVLQVDARARILIAGRAPGRKVHDSGVPFDDAGGERLRQWMGVSREVFYDPALVAILPMGFCYPGSGRAGDLPPRRECAPQWRAPAGGPAARRADARHRPVRAGLAPAAGRRPQAAPSTLTQTVRAWREHGPALLPLPHPSPRNNRWLKAQPWFAAELLPVLQARVAAVLQSR